VAKKLTIFLALLIGAQLHFAAAQADTAVPMVHADAAAMRIQEKAGKLFDKGKYDRAYFIYRNELAPIGDKYSQYMVGFMYLTGKSVERDRTKAAAWYRLAAERGLPEFVAAHQELLAVLDAEERTRSDRWYAALRTELGDLAVLMKGVRADYQKLRQLDRSRLPGEGNEFVGSHTLRLTGAATSEDPRRIEKRMKKRLEFIIDEIGINIDIDGDEIDLDLIEDAVYTHLRAGQ
jgi:hypothetical protein